MEDKYLLYMINKSLTTSSNNSLCYLLSCYDKIVVDSLL